MARRLRSGVQMARLGSHAQISFASSASLGMKWENVSVVITTSSSGPALHVTNVH